MLVLLLGGAAACSAPDPLVFGSGGGADGSGGAGSASHAASSGPLSSSSNASSSNSGASTGSASSSASASSSSGGAICGNGICEPPGENAQFCPQDCSGPASTSSSSSGAGGGTPMCSHPACDTGSKLDPSCDPCAATVCGSDPYCCDNTWDGQCVGEADQQCGACCGNGTCNKDEDCTKCPQDCGACPQSPTCKHSVCAVAEALDPMACRDPCVDMVCAQDPRCCMGPWQDKCGVLAAGCGADPCVSAVCAAMPSCCSSMWSQACVDQAKTSCSTPCDCAHDICQSGAALTATCSPCSAAVCKADAYCCNNNWDNICAGEVESVCGILCP